MMLSACRVMIGALGAGAMLAVAAPLASADPPPNCSAADLAGVASGVASATSGYLFTHPDVNNFFTGLEGADREKRRAEVKTYLDANPIVKAELTGIRQPLLDLKNRCGTDGNPDGDPALPGN